jgi:hypothetical protein
VYQALESALVGFVKIATGGQEPLVDKPLIDHLAHSGEFQAKSVSVFSRFDDELEMTDHDGVVVELGRKV